MTIIYYMNAKFELGKIFKRKRISYKDDLLYEGEHLNGKGKVYDYKDDLL